MSYVVKTEVINPNGICLENPVSPPIIDLKRNNVIEFIVSEEDPVTGDRTQHRVMIDTNTLVGDYIRRVYNLPDDTYVDVDVICSTLSQFGEATQPRSWGFYNRSNGRLRTAKAFSTEAEALEYVDTLGNPDPIITLPHNSDPGPYTLYTVYWSQEVDGVSVFRTADLRYTGDQVTLYTINDLINFLALFVGVTPEEVPVRHTASSSEVEPSLDCEPYIKATVVDVDGPGDTVEIDIDFTGGSIPGDVTVTVVDGDPVVSNTMIENGDGAVTIHDNGNIIMSNDGGTFFLNEFGNVGFYANNDASLTANTQVQLGVGGTSVTVENDCFTFRDGTGNVELTADELTRLKALLD